MKITHQITKDATTISIRKTALFHIGQAATIDVCSTAHTTKQATQKLVENLNQCVQMLKEMKEAVEKEFLE
jgi:hypothetical protein